MDFFGNKTRRLLLLIGAVLLCVWIVWSFLRGGEVGITTSFMPMNRQMQELLSRESSKQPLLSPKPTTSIKPAASAKSSAPKSTASTTTTSSSSKDTVQSERSPNAIIDPTRPGTISESSSSTPTGPQIPPISSPSQHSQPLQSSPHLQQPLLLDLNTATMEQLDKLPGIGESKAKAILEYRLKKGKFKRVEELMDVKGIGEKMFEKLKGLVYVAPS